MVLNRSMLLLITLATADSLHVHAMRPQLAKARLAPATMGPLKVADDFIISRTV